MSQNQAPPSKASTQHRSVGRIQANYTTIKEKTEIIVQKYVDEGDPEPDTEPERHHVRQASYGKYPEVYENREPLYTYRQRHLSLRIQSFPARARGARPEIGALPTGLAPLERSTIPPIESNSMSFTTARTSSVEKTTTPTAKASKRHSVWQDIIRVSEDTWGRIWWTGRNATNDQKEGVWAGSEHPRSGFSLLC
ncbi:hypothetical protein CMUS01_13773 [Colletotrichum musicola]|uniref:Uncharacterized protein n=1 Tax=Colletotrichum musicola TaxID=2175873 RepID=A0A8H6MUP0_9PEZI|nr:hypothetical protein CMUS01_13773 [Colletotrichum musicola]